MDKKRDIVSVLIVNYNNAKYLKNSIDSIIAQDYGNIEIIVVDDNSTDHSLKILKSYKTKIKIIKNKQKTGISFFDQMNCYDLAYKVSSGKILFFLDSDDYFHKTKVSKIMKFFYKNKKIEILYDLPIKLFEKKKINMRYKKKLISNYWPFLTPTSCITIKKKFFEKNLKLISTKSYKNIWMDFRIITSAKYIFKQYNFINKNLTYYRQTNTNVSSKFKFLSKNWWLRRWEAHLYIKYFFKKHSIKHVKNYDYFLTKFINFIVK